MAFMKGTSANAAGDSRHANRTPSNPRLWKLIVLQAKMKYKKYPNPAASHWVHDQYINHGGRFTDRDADARKKAVDKHRAEHEKEKHRAKPLNKKKGEDKDDKKK
jgi:hypothetical protein